MGNFMQAANAVYVPGLVVASAHDRDAKAQPGSARAVFERFVDLLYRRHQVRAAFESCVAREGFKDHAGYRSRASAMTALAPQLGAAAAQLELLHAVFDGDIGMVHLAVPPAGPGLPPGRRVEIFRIAEGRIVEHWSVAE
jgi:predicted SnoaL-like aldol condensation-catalyzing enzyme